MLPNQKEVRRLLLVEPLKVCVFFFFLFLFLRKSNSKFSLVCIQYLWPCLFIFHEKLFSKASSRFNQFWFTSPKNWTWGMLWTHNFIYMLTYKYYNFRHITVKSVPNPTNTSSFFKNKFHKILIFIPLQLILLLTKDIKDFLKYLENSQILILLLENFLRDSKPWS